MNPQYHKFENFGTRSRLIITLVNRRTGIIANHILYYQPATTAGLVGSRLKTGSASNSSL